MARFARQVSSHARTVGPLNRKLALVTVKVQEKKTKDKTVLAGLG